MDETGKNPTPAEELKDEELNTVAGGGAGYLQRSGEIFDKKGRSVGWNHSYFADFWQEQEVDHILYYPCSKCRGPMHQGKLLLWYCDPCDNWEIRPDEVYFEGSMSEFMRLANR